MVTIGAFQLGGLIAFTQLINYIVNPFKEFINIIISIRTNTGVAERVFELLDIRTEEDTGMHIEKIDDDVAIEFKNVSFSYNNSEKVLDNISFKIPRGKNITIVGPSGCGKSTIINLICRFYEPTDGVIRVNGINVNDLNIKSLRKNMALVTQDTFLFPVTIFENIQYGQQAATKEQIISAAKAANADGFIEETENGFDTLVGERGTRLSGGEKQRIAIARAILKDAPILLLDEPTSALDYHSEALVQKAIDSAATGRTVITVAHRLSTINYSDFILVLDNGKIVEEGSFEQLMAANGAFKQMYLKQLAQQSSSYERII